MDDFHPLAVWGSSLSSGAFLPEMEEGRTRGEARAAACLSACPPAAAAARTRGPQESTGSCRDLARSGVGTGPSCRPPIAQSPPLFRSLRSMPGAQTSRGPLRLREGSRVLTCWEGTCGLPRTRTRTPGRGGVGEARTARAPGPPCLALCWGGRPGPAGGFLESGFTGFCHLPKAVKALVMITSAAGTDGIAGCRWSRGAPSFPLCRHSAPL